MYAFKKNKTRFDFVQFEADAPIAHDSGIELLLSGTTTTTTYKQTKDEKPYLILERNVEHCSKDIDVQIYEKQVVYNNDYILKIYETVVDIEFLKKKTCLPILTEGKLNLSCCRRKILKNSMMLQQTKKNEIQKKP